jgi:imidazolonepropionase
VPSLLVDRIGHLVTWGDPPTQDRAAVVVEDGVVVWTGPSTSAPEADERLDAEWRCVVPGFVDAHTHLVFGGDRAGEFEARLAGAPYTAGGIRSTVAATRATSRAQLLRRARALATEALRSGTTTIEVKSGYGLDVATERKMLAVAAALPTPHRTFLGAHVVPAEWESDRDGYVDLVCGEMLEEALLLATGIDAFCEEGAFDVDECREVLQAGAARGLDVHVHANQLGPGGGAQLAASLGAASADHCTHLSDADITALHDAGVVAVLVPARSSPPARRTPRRGACSTPGWRSRWPATATRARRTRRRCRSSSRWPARSWT